MLPPRPRVSRIVESFRDTLDLTPSTWRLVWSILNQDTELKALLQQAELLGGYYSLQGQVGLARRTVERLLRPFFGLVTPHRLVSLVESLHATGRLSRVEASRAQERILTLTAATGDWK